MLSGAICRDQSCLVFKRLEKMKKGLEVYLPLTAKRVCRCQVVHVNDTDFYANGSKCIEIMQEILEMHIRLYEVTRAKIQDKKVKFYC